MIKAAYSLIVILVALCSIIRGFKIGISQQIASLLGFGFGAVAARVLPEEFMTHFHWSAALSQAPEFTDLTINLFCCVSIYTGVFLLFSILSPILRKTLSVFEVGIVNRICGAFFSLVKNLLWVSIAFNILLCIWPSSGLLYYERSNDGNMIAAVMDMTPAIIGCYGAQDFALLHQLKEAKSISCNFKTKPHVIIKTPCSIREFADCSMAVPPSIEILYKTEYINQSDIIYTDA